MTVKGGSRPACAACRFQRRRCSLDCVLAPYFPATKPEIFQNVHSLYGVGHILKILSTLEDDDQREEAMKSIIYESNIRQIHRVHGCYGLIVQLHQKLMQSMRELQRLHHLKDTCLNNISRPTEVDQVNDQVLGRSRDWMINGGTDLGFNYRNDQNVGNEWDDPAEITMDVPPKQSNIIDELQQFCRVEHDDRSHQDYTQITDGSFVDHDQQLIWPSKESSDLILESPMEDETYLIEPQELKPDEKPFPGVRSLETGFISPTA